MKKTLVLLGAAVFLLMACNKSETVVNEAQREISFKAMTGNITKANPEHTGTTLSTTDYVMRVGASIASNPTYITDQLFSYVTDKWKASKTLGEAADNDIYWPFGDQKVDFLAIAGKDGAIPTHTFNASNSANDVTFADWNTYTNQCDIMYAAANGQSKGANGEVALGFKHALALICFTAKAYAASAVKINSITINGLVYQGTLKVDNTNSVLTTVWSNMSAGANQTVKSVPSDYLGTSAAAWGDHLLVPEQGSKGITINYTVGTNSPANYELSIPRIAWEKGHKYTYALEFKSPQSIVVTPTVTDWTETGNGSTTVPDIE